MAEADAFIVAALQQSGWLEADTSWTVADLSSDALIVLVLKFLARSQHSDDGVTFALPCAEAKAPVGVAARHRVGSQLANILKELGYAGDCGYNHFLYPTEKETRNILSWLVGKLPRSKLEENEDEVSKNEGLGTIGAGSDVAASVLGNDQLANIFSNWKRETTLHMLPNQDVEGLRGFQRLPLQTSPLELSWNRPSTTTHELFQGFPSDAIKPTSLLEALAVAKRGSTMFLREDEYEEEEMDTQLKEGQVDDHLKGAESTGAIDAVIKECSTTESAGSARVEASPANAENIVVLGDQKEEQSLDEAQKQVDDTEHRIATMRKVLDRERSELQQVEQHVLETQTTRQEVQKQLARQKQLLAMLPQAQANIAKLEAICQTNAKKKAEIAQQMEIARQPLLTEYATLEGQKSSRKARCRQLIREIKAFRTEMLEITGIIHSKMESVKALERVQERQLAKLCKKDSDGPMTRSMYTSRIMDIIKQVHKQKQDIAKILDDIKGLQKQLNTASEKLKRTEAVAEEKLYSAASKSKSTSSTKTEAYVECYRKFAQVRELFEELILVVGDVGKKENAARDLQNWISQLESRDSSTHLDNVLADLESVRLENGTLQNELRAGIA
ncbi:hypothetical protein AM588_10004787 [Phytophthora nicotianae]|uniref:Coiled-coil domain-containing protein 22 n=1 Tax=Phytophthora nicotianae TaxID=4792 RepID=A0A0W8DBU2_PHYNI|nr:hypothetical protein AM588_10004787 [Phytophthora nicotianae]